jgi:hypothetical protein
MKRWNRLLPLAAVLVSAAAGLHAPTARAVLSEVRASSDVAVDLSATFVDREEVGTDDLAGTVTPIVFPGVPDGANLTAYALESGEHLVSFDTTVSLPGSVLAEPGDVVRYDGANYSIEFDASAEGVPGAASVDALSVDSGSDLLLSFDVTAVLGALTADDEDLVLFDGASFSLVFDGSAAGVPTGLDLDGAHDLSGGLLGLSFDGSGSLGGVAFDDEDVLEYDPSGPTWKLAFDASAEHAGWSGGPDADAVYLPEPHALVMLVCGLLGLALLRLRTQHA